MKRIALVLLAFFSIHTSHSQVSRGGSSTPQFVLDQFDKTFPDAEEIQWNRPRRGYSASFFLNGYPMTAFFDEDGEWFATKINIPQTKIPRAAMQHFRENYGNFRITDTAFHDAIGDSYYCIFISRGSYSRELHYDEKGNFMRETGIR